MSYKPVPPPKSMTRLPFDRDKMAMLPRDKIMEATFRAMDGVQNDKLELQMAAVSSLFAAYCERLALDPQAMYLMGKRMIRREPNHVQANDQIDALTTFVGAKASATI